MHKKEKKIEDRVAEVYRKCNVKVSEKREVRNFELPNELFSKFESNFNSYYSLTDKKD